MRDYDSFSMDNSAFRFFLSAIDIGSDHFLHSAQYLELNNRFSKMKVMANKNSLPFMFLKNNIAAIKNRT